MSTAPLKKRGVWTCSHPSLKDLPTQGWKIHISAFPSNTLNVAKILTSLLIPEGINFKLFADISDYYKVCAGIGSGYSQSGKFCTIYPKDYSQFVSLVVNLVNALDGIEGPKIVFDKQIPDTCIFYRYGVIRGGKSSPIFDADGVPYDDNRYKYKPNWVSDPLGEKISEYDKGSKEVRIPERYNIETLITQRSKGGVYEARDQLKNDLVIIKEGRKYGERDLFGVSGFDRILNEYYFYKHMSQRNISTPKLRDFFTIGEFSYLVIEKLETISDEEIGEEYLSEHWPRLLKDCAYIHECGYVFRDLKKSNLLCTKEGIFLIDFETVAHRSWESVGRIGTPAYQSPDFSVGRKADEYALDIVRKQYVYRISDDALARNYDNLEKIVSKIEKRKSSANNRVNSDSLKHSGFHYASAAML